MTRSGRALIIVFSAAAISVMLLCTPSLARENSSLVYKEGATLAGKGDIDGAIPLFEKAIKLSPNFALPHYALGRALLYKEGKRKDSIRELRLAVQFDRKLAKGYFYLGLAYMFDNKLEWSLHAFNDAFALDRSFVEALYNMAVVYDLMGQEGKSVRYFHKYIMEITRVEGEF
jgi:tetratricopeptide (TPR) repeat protein